MWLKSSTREPRWLQYLKLVFLEIPFVTTWSVFQNQVTNYVIHYRMAPFLIQQGNDNYIQHTINNIKTSILWTLAYLTLWAMISRLHTHTACITSVHNARALVVQFIQHHHSRILDSSQGGELQMPLSSHGQKRVPPLHKITNHDRVRIHCTH